MSGDASVPPRSHHPEELTPEGEERSRLEQEQLFSGSMSDEIKDGAGAPENTTSSDTLPQIPRGPALREKVTAAAAGSDTKAQKEEDQFGSKRSAEQLAEDAAELEHGRTQRFRDAFEHVAIGALFVGGCIILVLAAVWALHLVLPADKRWLTAEDLTHIQTLLTAGVLVGVVSSHFKKRLGDLK